MPSFRTQKQVAHSADKMFALVADIERYPEFLPMCESLTVRSRKDTQVYLRPKEHLIEVQYIDGPFKYLHNRWQFLPAGAEAAAQSGAAAGPGDSGAAGVVSVAILAQDAAASKANAARAIDAAEAGAVEQTVKAAKAGAASETARVAKAAAAAGIAGEAGAVGRSIEAANNAAAADTAESCIVDFYIDYAFKNPMLSMLMGAMFDIAFRKFTAAFITRADKIYGIKSND